MGEEKEEVLNEERKIASTEIVAPVAWRRAFHCPHCGVYVAVEWHSLFRANRNSYSGLVIGDCLSCRRPTVWLVPTFSIGDVEDVGAVLIWPQEVTSAPRHHDDMPSDVAVDFDEARDIVERSPRGAAALLRLAVQKLMVDLEQPGKNINDDIAALVKRGLPVEVQQALDALRVIGNNAVHPGELNLKDDRDTALALFGLLNFIVEQRISQPKKLAKLYGSLPAGAVAAIQKRDGSGS